MAEILKISHEEYRNIKAINRSVLLEGVRSMAHVQAAVLAGYSEASDAAKIGLAAHCALLEPLEFPIRFGVKTLNWTTKEGKAEKESLLKKHTLDQILDEEDYATVCAMVVQATAYDECASVINEFLKDNLTEQTILFDKNEVRCKARLDAISLKHHAVIDYKTTEDASENAFTKSIGNWKYHIQAAFYIAAAQAAGFDIKHYVLIAQEKKSPYLCGIYRLDPESIERGERTVNYILSRIAECQETNKWPGYGANIKSISAPQWA